jgi:phosphoribosylaminoimidazole carboxylase (NCAIR synthetase)
MKKIGILGAGQLGRMLALAGYPLGLRFRFFDPAPDSPANLLADHLTADYADEAALRRFVDGLDVVTYEFENVPVETARFLEQFVPVYPPPLALEKAQDRLVEKNFFRSLGIPTPEFSGLSESGLSRGFTDGNGAESGLSRGFTDGNGTESGLSRGLADGNGTESGLSHGLTDGNGTESGLFHGLTDGNGTESGLSRGLTHGNGAESGLSRRFTDGNGAESGLIHGLTDGNGVGFPAVLKTRRMGYDGKGQVVVHNQAELAAAREKLAGQDLILEAFVPFDRECSIVCVRSLDGSVVFYPLSENTHRDGILRLSVVESSGFDERLQAQAEAYARAVLDALGYVGVLAIEFFEKDGQLLANEMAPRVHNSGHWSIDGAVTSQFENHIRAVCGLPLGSTSPLGASAMVNLIGDIPAAADILAIEGAHLHLYDKAPRPGRKVGHINLVAGSRSSLDEKIGEVQKYVR